MWQKRMEKKGNLFEPLLGVSKPSTVNATKMIKGQVNQQFIPIEFHLR
jgi:hypothetical protein